MDFPKTRREEVREERYGHVVSDPYRWLENPEGAETKAWIKDQNTYLHKLLRTQTFDTFSQEFEKNFKFFQFSTPYLAGGKYFYSERKPDEDQMAVYVKKGLDGAPVCLVNPNGMNKDNTVTVDFWNESRTGKYLVYGLSQGGAEMATLHVKEVDTDNDLPDTIPNCRYSTVRWLPDDSGFYYTRNPRPGSVPKDEEHLHTKIYLHMLGSRPENDELIFGEGRPKDDMLHLSLSLDGRYVSIQVSRTWTENELYIYDRVSKKITPIAVDIPAKFSLYFASDKAVVQTNYGAEKYRLLFASLDTLLNPIDQWKELVPEKEHILQTVALSSEKLILEYLANVCSRVLLFDLTGKELEEVSLPPYSSVGDISANAEEREFFYSVISYTFPKIVYRYVPEDNHFVEYRKIDNPINPDEFIVQQEWFFSKDGTTVPMFIIHKQTIELNGDNPTILWGYGGFAEVEQPQFLRNFIPWLERGGIFAAANLRGNADFGEKWHVQGIKENKQNTFDDFIAAAEYLVSQHYTDSAHLGILGESNGGLLVAAVAVQRPDLFNAVCSRVPLTDMVRFHKFGIAIRWVHEYGNPDIKKDFENILKWSPYHNVKEGIEYPPILFTTADKDTRVDPLHARKMAALLQSVNKRNSVLIFTEVEAGHGPGKPIKKVIESQAFIQTFFVQQLGLTI